MDLIFHEYLVCKNLEADMKTKRLILIAALVQISILSFGQHRFMTKSGFISFYSHTPVEDIKAENKQVTSLVDFNTGELVFSVLIRSFEFEKALMQEHFNENYLESDKFPKAKFVGKILNYESYDWNQKDTIKVKVSGGLEIHGINRDIETAGAFYNQDGIWIGESIFTLKPEDYDIKIPKVVRNNIAREIEVTVKMNYLATKSKQ